MIRESLPLLLLIEELGLLLAISRRLLEIVVLNLDVALGAIFGRFNLALIIRRPGLDLLLRPAMSIHQHFALLIIRLQVLFRNQMRRGAPVLAHLLQLLLLQPGRNIRLLRCRLRSGVKRGGESCISTASIRLVVAFEVGLPEMNHVLILIAASPPPVSPVILLLRLQYQPLLLIVFDQSVGSAIMYAPFTLTTTIQGGSDFGVVHFLHVLSGRIFLQNLHVYR